MVCAGEFSGDIDTELLLKEFKRSSAQEKFDKELREIDKRLEQKEVNRSPIERVTLSLFFTIQRSSSSRPHICSLPVGISRYCEYER